MVAFCAALATPQVRTPSGDSVTPLHFGPDPTDGPGDPGRVQWPTSPPPGGCGPVAAADMTVDGRLARLGSMPDTLRNFFRRRPPALKSPGGRRTAKTAGERGCVSVE